MEGVDDGRPLESASPISAAFGCLCLSHWLHISSSVQLAGNGITVSPRCLNLLVGIATLGRTRGESSESRSAGWDCQFAFSRFSLTCSACVLGGPARGRKF